MGETKTALVLAVGRDHRFTEFSVFTGLTSFSSFLKKGLKIRKKPVPTTEFYEYLIELTVPIWKQSKWCKRLGFIFVNKLLPTLSVYPAMRKIFIILAMVMGISIVGAAQNSDAKVQRNGNVFSSTKQTKAKVEPMATTFQWEDAKGVQYPIWVNPNSGRCFVLKTSKKSGKEYKYYLGEEISKAVCKEMNITYVEKEE